MKPLIITLLAALLPLTLVACGGTPQSETEGATSESPLSYESAEDVLSQVWNAVPQEDRFYVGGGNTHNPDTMTEGAPGKFVALSDRDYDDLLGYPAADVSKIDDAASLFHGMNVNNFTCAVFHFADSADVTAMVEPIRKNILARQWVCGSPEKTVIIKLPGNYLMTMWGLGEGAVDTFAAKTLSVIDGATVVAEQNIG